MKPIKIAHVHNFYQLPGGEDQVVKQEAAMLRSLGHEVVEYRKHNDEIRRMPARSRWVTALRTPWSPRSYREFKRFLAQHKPDLVHFHNTFPLISPSACYAAKKMGIPVVQTLHNYRLLCPGGAFFRQGEICEKCVERSLGYSLVHRCYRDSLVQTAAVALMLQVNRMLRTWDRKVDRYIVLTEFAKRKFVDSGLPEHKIVVKPNFVQSETDEAPKKAFFLYVGRLSREKGVDRLIESWKALDPSNRLIVIGDGPDGPSLRSRAEHCPHILFLGSRDSDVVMQYMREARFLIVPSVCYEGFPMTVVEAYSVGTPVIGNAVGSLEEIVEDGVTGYHYQAEDEAGLAEAIRKAGADEEYERLRANVRLVYRKKYSKRLNEDRLMRIYEELVRPEGAIADWPPDFSRLRSGHVLETKVTALSLRQTADEIEKWAVEKISKYVCVCTTHSLVTATERSEFRTALNRAGICTPDGMPLVWALRALGFRNQERVDGTSLMKELCGRASRNGYGVYLYGCTPATLASLEEALQKEFPGLRIVGTASPPFRELSEEEELGFIADINACRPDFVFVALGCPKQELWMHRHRHRVHGVMLGVGAAFDYIAGNLKRPPRLVQNAGLEWLFRLMMEPRRLWRRYAHNNSKFIYKYLLSFRRNRIRTRKTEA
ncbi:WecB/TagA/CpsF family glycosyltransferase [Cohnella hongkongensis]|uniref:WecB/TagA/CpsF family glycosyltransferase n=1 Tax=Cohnella hongkongensis TaxID=178337 RepID=A0ABV9FB80_9BACL